MGYMKIKLWVIGLVLFCTLLTSFGQVFLKMGSKTFVLNLSLFTNYALIIGVLLYLFGAVIFIIALKHGELSVLYPFIALSFIWVSFLSTYFFGEVMNLYKWLGILVIIIGVSFIGKGSKVS